MRARTKHKALIRFLPQTNRVSWNSSDCDRASAVSTPLIFHFSEDSCRKYGESYENCVAFWDQYDVRFIAINNGVDSANSTSDYTGIRNYFNDLYARDTSRKIRAVQRAKGERGERVGTTIPYGYMKNPDNAKQLLPDPETAPIVKRIFEMYANGIGIRKICTKFREEQVLSPSVYSLRKTED